MTFKKEFPSLKKNKAITLWNSGEYTFDKDIGRDDDTAFSLQEIRKHCLDKQRVIDAIEKIRANEWVDSFPWYSYLKDELGLEG